MRCSAPVAYQQASAVARCHPGPIALGIDYTGIIGQFEFNVLDRSTLGQRLAHRLSVERLDKAILLPGPLVIDPASWPRGAPMSVVIVRDDQYQAAQDFCHALGLLGVTRLAFRVSQTALALALVDRLTG